MRRSLRDWVAWSLLASIIAIASLEYYTERETGMSSPQYVYKMVVTAQRLSR